MRRAKRPYRGSQSGYLLRVTVITGEQEHAADQGVRQHPGVIRTQFRSGDIDHERSQTHTGPSNTAIDSTCVVCGNISITPAQVSVNPWVPTKISASRAKLPGWQEIYTTRRGRQCAMRVNSAQAPARGGSS